MKNFLFISLVSLGLIVGCDKTEDPFNFPTNNNGGGNGDTTNNDTTLDLNVQKVLLEDLTGFRCTNCPPAQNEASLLQEVYGEQLIVVGVHMVDFYAEPEGDAPGDPFYTDFRTEAGHAYEQAFNVLGLPNGMVNRTIVDGSQVMNHTDWGTVVPTIIAQTPKAAVFIDALQYNENSRVVSFDVDMAIEEDMEEASYFMTLYLTEDSIYDWQKFPGGIDEDNYLHRHVLRDNINGTWGDLAFSNGTAGQENTLSYSYTIDQAWKEEHCEIVAYIYNADTREIVQADKVLVMNP